MKPRIYKVNKHRSFAYYTPEDVEKMLAETRYAMGIVGNRWFAQGTQVRDAKFSSRNDGNIVCVCENHLHAKGIARALNIAGMVHVEAVT